MVLQDKTKFGSPKYRLVVRFTNKDIVAQIVHAKIKGDDVIAAAYSHELKAFGITHGLTNYAAAYSTGLLLARRTLNKLKIDKEFEGAKEATGAFAEVRTKKEDQGDDEKRFPFKAILDIGLARTTTGARIFGVLKGAVDGGVAVPHRPNRFPGFDKKKGELNAKTHRDRIFGKHVADYLKQVKEENDEGNTVFASVIKAGITPESIEGIYKKAHAAIRANPVATKKAKKDVKSKNFGTKKTTKTERKANAAKKVASIRAALKK
eukprot:GILJ01004678.1.p2 GENE.GILJ01004678.1~~GILJ01004678.1.p2  ORF type:complete len:310 (-),score=94.18 GILJ01004678.1:66-857(-)